MAGEDGPARGSGGVSDEGAMVALLRANVRAGELRHEQLRRPGRPLRPGIVRGAPSHDLSYLLTALEEAGWKLVQA